MLWSAIVKTNRSNVECDWAMLNEYMKSEMKNYNNKPSTKWISVQLFWFIGAYDIRSYIDPSGTKMQTAWSLSTMQVMQFETQPTLSSVIFSSAFSETCLIYVGIYWQTIMVSMVS